MDLNCDMGEGMGQEEIIFPFISSVNIACGAHAGDDESMCKMVELALIHGVAIGAHPSYPDRANFGRVDLIDSIGQRLRPEDLPAIIGDQLYRLQKIGIEFGAKIGHVKPHGALYNRAAWDGVVASFICSTVRDFDAGLLLYGLSGSEMAVEAEACELSFVHEAFADRSYQDDGSLVPRTEPGALIEDPQLAVLQALQIACGQNVIAKSGKAILLRADTICLHGDGTHAPLFAQQIHHSLQQQGIRICPPAR
jgi:UPF0271 protein